jgi:hypothetical protein
MPRKKANSAANEVVGLFARLEKIARARARGTAMVIPADYVREAARVLRATGQPFLPQPEGPCKQVIIASADYDEGFTLSTPEVEAPPPTWRDYMAWQELTPAALRKRFGVSKGELDQPLRADAVTLDDMDDLKTRLYGTPTGNVFWLFQNLPIAGEFSCLEVRRKLGGVECIDGPSPGSDYQAVRVTSPLALSCLQFALSALRTGICLEVE